MPPLLHSPWRHIVIDLLENDQPVPPESESFYLPVFCSKVATEGNTRINEAWTRRQAKLLEPLSFVIATSSRRGEFGLWEKEG